MSESAASPGPDLYDRWAEHGTADGSVTPPPIPLAPIPLPPIPLPTGADAAAGAAAFPHTVTFRPRRATRRALSAVLLVWIAASAVSVLAAWREPSQPTIGIAAAIVVLTALTWVVRAGTSVAQLSVRGGVLEIRKGGQKTTFSLRDSYQLIDVVGRPGRPGWKVLFHRQGHPSYVVDGSLVQPREFMRVLRHYRPGL